mgnify:CR=1 FL=1
MKKGRLEGATDYLMLPCYFSYKLTGIKSHEYTEESTGSYLNAKDCNYDFALLEKLGFDKVSPRYDEERTDIIQTMELKSKENLVKFVQGLQESSPVDSFVRVMAAPMPGYPFDEVMASGAFTQGSTIELSGDAPVVPPYTLYMQGGLTPEYGKLGIMLALTKMKKEA